MWSLPEVLGQIAKTYIVKITQPVVTEQPISGIWSYLRVAESEVGLFVVLELALFPGLQEVLLQVEHLTLVPHVHPVVPALLPGGYVPGMVEVQNGKLSGHKIYACLVTEK